MSTLSCRASMVGGIALATILWALPAQAYHCRAGKVWLRHDRVCVAVQHQATRHARVRRHHAHSYVRHEHSYARRVRVARHRPVERPIEEPVEPPPMKRGDRLVTEPRPVPQESPAFTLPFDIPPTTTIRQPPQWRL